MRKLKIAIQKSGRLKEGSLQLLAECGIQVENGRDQLKVTANNFPIEVFYLRNADIPAYVQDGIVDVAIIGENLLVESNLKLKKIMELGFSKCRVSLAVPTSQHVEDLSWFQNKKIATSYPVTLKQFLAENDIKAAIHTISGSVEIAPGIGLADGILDIVSTGNTLYRNDLKEVFTVLKSEAILIRTGRLSVEIEKILNRLSLRLNAVLKARNSRYVLMNVPNKCIADVANLLPVLKSATVLPLQKQGWSSLHSVINQDDFWNVIDALKEKGAEDILVAPIEKIVR